MISRNDQQRTQYELYFQEVDFHEIPSHKKQDCCQKEVLALILDITSDKLYIKT